MLNNNLAKLNKDICKKCIKRHCAEYLPWTDKDERNWKYFGQISCAFAPQGAFEYVNKPPPSNCPYILEHLVSEFPAK